MGEVLADRYEVEHQIGGGDWVSVQIAPSVTSAEVSTTDGEHSFRVRACGASECSVWTNLPVPVPVTIPVFPIYLPVETCAPLDVTVPQQEPVGAIAGQASVSGGAAVYEIPIEMAPGRRGMAPSFGLAYSSKGGADDIAGIGWSISGLSQIHRCDRIAAVDGAFSSVAFTAGDAFCLDGQRLNFAGYRADGAMQFRTEVDNFARITRELDGLGFTVERKSGVREHYGADLGTSDALETMAAGVVYAWWLKRAEDRQGNTVVYRYRVESGQHLPAGADYTGFGGAPGNRHVEFTYADRPAPRTAYVRGYPRAARRLLSSVTSSVDGDVVRRYELHHTVSRATGRPLLTRVEACGSTAPRFCRPPTTFEYQDEPHTFVVEDAIGDLPSSSFERQRVKVFSTRDYDGDGTKDLVRLEYLAPGQFVRTSLTIERSNLPAIDLLGLEQALGFDRALMHDVERAVDVDGDGFADFLGVVGGQVVLATEIGGTYRIRPTDLWVGPNARLRTAMDFNGDGRIDLMVDDAVPVLHFQCAPTGTGMSFCDSAVVSIAAGERILLIDDFDGNGRPDFFVDEEPLRLASAGPPIPSRIMFAFPAGQTVTFVSHSLESLGGPSGSFKEHSRWNTPAGFFDPNGDGLTDIYRFSDGITVWINTGGLGPDLFQRVLDHDPAGGVAGRHRAAAVVMDYDTDGRDEILVPSGSDLVVPWCWNQYVQRCATSVNEGCANGYQSPGHNSISSLVTGMSSERASSECHVPLSSPTCTDDFQLYCTGGSSPMDFTLGKSGLDRSIHGWEVIEVDESPAGLYTARRIPASATGIVLPILAVGAADYHGDGLADLEFQIANLWGELTHGPAPLGHYPEGLPAGLEGGPKVARNTGRYPDLMTVATNGLGAVTRWAHHPLASSGSEACVSPAGLPFYDKAPSTALDPPHALFASSLHVVSRFAQSDGLGGERARCFRYRNATYDNRGRGFLGFEQVIEEEALGDGNDLRTMTAYHLAHPLTGRTIFTSQALAADPVTLLPSGLIMDAAPIRSRTESWEADRADRTYGIYHTPDVTCFTRLLGTYAETRDPSSRQIMSTSLVNNAYSPGDANHGNVTRIEEITSDAFGVYRTVRDYQYAYDVGGWWLDQLERVSVASDPGVVRTTVLPAMPGNVQKVVTTDYEYYPDGHPWARLPSSVERQKASADWSRVALDRYDSYGNLELAVTTAIQVAVARPTVDAYDSEGYFIEATTNALGHREIRVIDPKSGQVVRSEKDMGAGAVLIAQTTLDAFGQVTRVDSPGVAPAFTRRVRCGSACPPLAVYEIVQIQRGSPETRTYLDMFERPIQVKRRAFDRTDAVVQRTSYDARGRVLATSEPASAQTAPHWTSFEDFDPIGRPARKVRDMTGYTSLDASGTRVPDEALVIEYTYAGPTTSLDVDGRTTSTRTTDAFGRLVESVDAAGTPTVMRYDAHGNLIFVRVNGGNDLHATYDDLGRRVAFSDPDRGAWSLEYDGLGELTTQYDGNGAVVSFLYDELGRTTARYVNGALQSRFHYDARGHGLLHREEVFARTNVEYAREFFFDPLFRNERTETTFDGRTFTVAQTYDCNGRVRGMEYPNREAVEYRYGPSGHLVSERNPRRLEFGATGLPDTQVYREVLEYSPRNEATYEVFGNGTHQRFEHRTATGQVDRIEVQAMRGAGLQTVLSTTYDYTDGLMNLTSRSREYPSGVPAYPGVRTIYETLSYDPLQRLERATTNWAMASGSARPPERVDYGYDALGNILEKSDYALDYQYGSANRSNQANAGPHAITAVLLAAGGYVTDFRYDGNGNQIEGDGRTITYSFSNQPTRIVENGVTTELFYGPHGERYKQVSGGRTTRYVDTHYEEVEENGITEQRAYAGSSVIVTRVVNGPIKRRWLHRDRLGSSDAITDEDGELVEAHCFSPFGAPLSSICDDNGTLLHSGEFSETNSSRGFTGHEHLDAHHLIHMNGRAYDPRLGRFLGTDPFVQIPEDSQNWNPYSYILNNPLSGADPSGYVFWKDTLGGIADFVQANAPSVSEITQLSTAVTVGGPVGLGVFVGVKSVGKAIDTAGAAIDAYQREGVAGVLYAANERLNPVVRVLERGSEFLNASKSGDVRTAVRTGLETLMATEETIGIAAAGVNLKRGACSNCDGSCFTAGTAISVASGAIPIEAIRPGDRVSSMDDAKCAPKTIDPETCRIVRVSLEAPYGYDDILVAELLRDADWVEAEGASPGAALWLNLDELAIHAQATVEDVRDCEVLESSPGCLVTMTVTHLNRSVLRVRFEESAAPVELTALHPLYSEDRDDWVQAFDLQIGERLRTRHGTATLATVERLPGAYQVYNLEVDGAHTYLASGLELHSHNAKCTGADAPDAKRSEGVELTGKGRKKIGNLFDLKDVDAAKAIVERGGNAGNVRKALGDALSGKTVGEIANMAATGNKGAETALKIIKQAAKKGQDH